MLMCSGPTVLRAQSTKSKIGTLKIETIKYLPIPEVYKPEETPTK